MPHQYDLEVLYRTSELYLDQVSRKKTTKEIAEQVNRDLKPDPPLTRQSVYRVLAQARSSGVLRLVPPVSRQLTEKLRGKFQISNRRIIVVNTLGGNDGAKVAFVAADEALEIIRELGNARPAHTVGLGLGPGRATLDFCKHLGEVLAAQSEYPKLRLVAITAGCPATLPEYASSSFFNLFPSQLLSEKIGLFAESVVRVKDFARVRRTPGVHEAFDARQKDLIDVVVTSMGDFSDEHDLLRLFVSEAGMSPSKIRARGWIGNVQYRPYTHRGPALEARDEYRAVTLFELNDLVAMSKLRDRHVILIARQCGICGMSRARALFPILTNPELQVFSTLVLDSATALELMKM